MWWKKELEWPRVLVKAYCDEGINICVIKPSSLEAKKEAFQPEWPQIE
jgi:hypothetical protein